MAHVDLMYNNLVKAVLWDGFSYLDASRDNIAMLQIPSYELRINMLEGFPLLTTKRIYYKSIFHELIWMLSGAPDISYLQKNNVKIWDKDAANFDKLNGIRVGRIYGPQWRTWAAHKGIGSYYIDQISGLITGLKNDFHNRRHIVTAWNPAELDDMALPPCHWSFEILPCKASPASLIPTGFALKWHQRSCDLMLGIPFDIGLYATLGKLIEKEIGIQFVTLIGDLSNIHLYGPHIKLAQQQLFRVPVELRTDLLIKPQASLFRLHIDDLDITEYKPHLPIKAELFAKVNKQP